MFITKKIIDKSLEKCALIKSVNLILLSIFFLSAVAVGVIFNSKSIEAQISDLYNQNNDEIAGISPLMSAVTENDIVGVRFFSKAGRSIINQKNIGGATALHMACREKNFEIVRILIENGADINIVDNEGWTPLMRASMAGDAQIVDFLLTKGATAENINSVGESAIIHATLADCDLCIDAIFKRGNLIRRLRMEKLKEQLTNAFVIAKNHDNQNEQELLERYLDQAIKMMPLMQMQRQEAAAEAMEDRGTFIALDEVEYQSKQNQSRVQQPTSAAVSAPMQVSAANGGGMMIKENAPNVRQQYVQANRPAVNYVVKPKFKLVTGAQGIKREVYSNETQYSRANAYRPVSFGAKVVKYKLKSGPDGVARSFLRKAE